MLLAGAQRRFNLTHASFEQQGSGMRGVSPPANLRRHIAAVNNNHRLRASVDNGASGAPVTADLMKQLVRSEQELAMMFQSGRPVPTAGEVAKLRGEIAALRELINEKQAASLPQAALAAAEGELCEQEQLQLLQAENQRLRARATALLERQCQLQLLWEQQVVPHLRGHGSRSQLRPEEDDVAQMAVQLADAALSEEPVLVPA